MSREGGMSQRWNEFRPSKGAWFWSMAGAAVVTMIVGFTAGGWVTGGSAEEMAENAARAARASLASAICVEKFVTSASAAASLAELKETSTYEQDDFIVDGGWVALIGVDDAVPGAADLCADELMAMESLPVRDVSAGAPTADG